MSKKITHKFEMPNGEVVTRVSSGRRYTYIVIWQRTQEECDRIIAHAEKSLANAEAEAERRADDATCQAELEKILRTYPLLKDTYSVPYLRESAANSVEHAKAYLESVRSSTSAGEWYAHGWSQSRHNAEKAAATCGNHHSVVRVCEVTDIVERAVKQAKTRTSGKLTKAQQALLDHVKANAEEGAKLWSGFNQPQHKLRVADVLVARGLIELREVPTGRMIKRYRNPLDAREGVVEVEATEHRYFLKN